MADILQYRNVVELEFRLGEGETKINMKNTDNNYYSKLDDIKIDSSNVELSNLVFNKNGIKLKFNNPINCNIQSGKHYSTMTCGTKLEGNNKEQLVEKIESLASRLIEE